MHGASKPRLAKSMLTRVELRDPHKLFHKMEPSPNSKRLMPAFHLGWHISGLWHLNGTSTEINVTEPKYLSELKHLLKSHPIADWRAFLRWNVIHEARRTFPHVS